MAAGAQPDSAAGRHSGTRRRIVSKHIIMVDIGAGIDDRVLAYLGTRIEHCACHYDSPRSDQRAWRNNGCWMDDRGPFPTGAKSLRPIGRASCRDSVWQYV